MLYIYECIAYIMITASKKKFKCGNAVAYNVHT